jgi:fibronectin-binding autotransporter adhesin
MGIEIPPLMNTVKLLLLLCGLMTTTTLIGQTTYVWTGAGDGTNIDAAANYGGTLPQTGSSDIAQFNGTVPGNLALNYSIGNWASGPGNSGVNLQFTSDQVGNVSLDNRSANANPPNIAIYAVQIQAGAGVFTWGTNGNRVNYAARPSGIVHDFLNESTNTAIIGNQIHYVAGGGAAYTMAFGGTGDWLVNSWLTTDNGAGVTVTRNGTGTLTWNPTGYSGGSGGIDAVNVNGGTLILTAPISKLNTRPIANAGTFIVNMPAQSQILSGVRSGAGEFRYNGGTVTLSGASTYTGNTILNGGIAVLNGAENVGVSGPLGLGNTISFAGGTLQFSVNNTFDYSPRFSTAAGQAIRIDTGGQNVTFTNALTSSGGTLTKLAPGTLTLTGANTYDGATAIGAGKLVIQGTAGTGNIIVSNSASLGVTGGSQIQPTTLTVGTSGSATLEFNNINSTSTPLIAAGTVSAGGAITININGGTFVAGQDYPLLSWTSGSAPAVSLGTVIGVAGTLNTNGNTIRLNVSALAYKWDGAGSANWDTTAVNNWLLGVSPVLYSDPNPVLFDDTATGETNVIVNAVLQPATVTVNNSTKSYSIASSGANRINGSASLTKANSGTLTLSGGVNDFTGATTINGGTVSVGSLANGGVASDLGAAGNGAANLVLNGGALLYTGTGATSDHLFTIGTAGARIESSGTGNLNLNNSGALGLSGSGARTLTLTTINGNGDTLAAVIGDNGGATAVTKTGTGKWILTGNSTRSGLTTVANGVLEIGTGGALGSGDVANNASLNFNVSGTLTVSGSIGGTGRVTNSGPGTVILAGNSSYQAGTFIDAGTLQFGTGGASGTVFGNGDVAMANNSTVIFNSTSPINIGAGGDITGQGNVIVRAGASVIGGDGGAVNYSGWTLIDSGATFQPCTGQTADFRSAGVTNNGTLTFISQNTIPTFIVTNAIVGTGRVWADTRNQNAGQVALAGNNTYTGGTFVAGGGITLGDGVTPGTGSIVGSVIFTNTTGPFVALFSTAKRFQFNRPDTFTFTNDMISMVSDGSTPANQGSVEVQLGTVILTGNNSYPGDTTVSNGATLQSGIGGTGGSIGSGAKVIEGTLVFNRSANVSIEGVVSGTGSLVKTGSGTLTLTNNNTFTGTTTVSNGTMVINGADAATSIAVYGGTFGGAGTLAGSVTLSAGTTLAPGASVGTLTINNNLDIGGHVAIEVNKSLAQSNDFVVVIGTLNKIGAGNLTVANVGPALQVGDKFTLFSQPLVNGGALTVTGAGATWQNDLATDGSITVLTVAPVAPPTLNVVQTGSNLQFSWTGSFKLQSQTNTLGVGLNTNWADYPGGGTSPVNVTINPANPSVFFRLATP